MHRFAVELWSFPQAIRVQHSAGGLRQQLKAYLFRLAKPPS